MKILVLTDPYGKPAYAPRLRFFCDYLVAQGHDIEVYTEPMENYDFAHAYPIVELPVYHGKIDWMLKSFWSLLTDWRNRHFSRVLRRAIRGKQFDLVFCTTFSTFPLRAAWDVAQERQIPLHADIRDLDEQVPGAQYQSHRAWWTRPFRAWYRAVNIRRRNRVLRQANQITTISPWHVDFVKQLNPNVHLIYNGFDATQFYAEDIPVQDFKIGYIGRIYEFQTTQLIEQAVAELQHPDIVLDWHTPEHNSLSINEIGDTIRRCSIMLVLTNPAAHGMMTTKFYEALGCEKPILCLPSDEGCLKEVMEETNVGLASGDVEEIKRFILDKYAEWKQHGYTHQAVRDTARFSRQYQAKQLETLLLHLR